MKKKPIKIRKTLKMNPTTKVHSSPKGKVGYTRIANKRIEKNWEKE